MSILLVEDNPLTAKGLQYLLEREHYRVEVASTAAAARKLLDAGCFQLAILDVALPDGDGFELAGKLRAEIDNLPVIFLTARDEEDDVVRGLELGAEDYIAKPFRNRELLLRVRAVFQRHRPVTPPIQTVGRLSLDHSSGEILLDGQALSLTALERQLLACFLEAPGQIISRERLLDEVWSASGSMVNDNTISVYIKRLRAKLADAARIETVKSLGYRLHAGATTKAPAPSQDRSEHS